LVYQTAIMRARLTALFVLFFMATASAQTIQGTVKDGKAKGLPGVSVSIKDSYDGATTDSLGQFSFTTSEMGEQTIVVTAVGYKPVEQQVTIDANLKRLDFLLKEEITELKAVVISAGTFEASDRKKATVLSSLDILTTASANADVTGALKTLPGAQQVGESEGLFVRGGTAAETKTFMDGTLVNNFFYSSVPGVAQRGRFSPWFLKGTVFSTGGYSALYGQALSSAVVLETVDLPEQSSGNLGLSVIGASGGYQQLAKNKKSSFGFSYAYTNLWLAFKAIKQKQNYSQVPVYHTADANFRIKTSNNGIIKYYGYFSTNKLRFTTPSIDSLGYNDAFGIRNVNHYHNLSYREALGAGWKLNAGISYTYNKDDIEGQLQNSAGQKVELQNLETKNFGLLNTSRYTNAKLVLEKKWSVLNVLRFGSEYNQSNEAPHYTLFTGEEINGKIKENVTALFAEGDVYITNNLAAKLGARAEHSKILNEVNIAPRVSVAYKLTDKSQASFAYGIFYQSPETRYQPATVPLSYAKATHYIAQYQKFTATQTLRTELFYKRYQNLLKTGMINNREVAVNDNGYGEAKGFEVFWRDKKSIKGVDYWVSYSHLDTERDYLNFPKAMQPHFAATHTASVVVKKFVTNLKTQVNASYTYASGRPYYNLQYNHAENKFKINDAGKTIDYNSVSLSVNYLPNIFKQGAGKFTVLVFSVTNVLGNKQVYGYNYSYNGYRKEAIIPPSKSFVFVGAFISLGVDRTDDIINSNL